MDKPIVVESDWAELPLIPKGKTFVYENGGLRFEGIVLRSQRSRDKHKAWLWVEPKPESPHSLRDVHLA